MPLDADDFNPTSIIFPEASEFTSRSISLDPVRSRSIPFDLLGAWERILLSCLTIAA
jgi:hypothetical protein